MQSSRITTTWRALIALWDWIDPTKDGYLVLAGLIPGKMENHLHKGWNLVPCPSLGGCGDVRSMKPETGLGKVERAEVFDPHTPPYYLRVMGDGDNLLAYRCYRVKATESVIWKIYGDHLSRLIGTSCEEV